MYYIYRHYLKLMPICTFVLPTIIPYLFWGENLWISFLTAIFRYVLALNFTWLVNSAAHIWGMKPYDKSVSLIYDKLIPLLFHTIVHIYSFSFPSVPSAPPKIFP